MEADGTDGPIHVEPQPKFEPQRRKMSCGIDIPISANISEDVVNMSNEGYHFIVTHFVHPDLRRNLIRHKSETTVQSMLLSRTDRLLISSDWSRLIVGKVSPYVDVDSEVEHIRQRNEALLTQELDFASHLGVPIVQIKLSRGNNANLARILHNKLMTSNYQVWMHVKHAAKSSPCIKDNEAQPVDYWERWNEFRTVCNYDRKLSVVLEMPDNHNLPTEREVDRWLGEPVKCIILNTRLFLKNNNNQPVLSKPHQEIIKKFLSLDVQYIIRGASPVDSYKPYCAYIHFLGKKLWVNDTVTDFVRGCEDFLQNPLQPLTENLDSTVYEVFERDDYKYYQYQRATEAALAAFADDFGTIVVMVVGAGRGPLVQAALNAAKNTGRTIKMYVVEKNPYAVNTLADRVLREWGDVVTLVTCDMREYNPPEEADIIISELLGSFGDNELSPECLDGAQRFLKKGGISIPCSYTSFLAPLQSIKIFNEIFNHRQIDKPIEASYETPYVVHLVNCYRIAEAKPLFTFIHPNEADVIDNKRYMLLKFKATQNCVLTGFAGYFETDLYQGISLSINPLTHSPNMVSWFPIVFSLPYPVNVKDGDSIEIAFWRCENHEKVWYQWCLMSPVVGKMNNPNGRSYHIKKK